MTTKVEERLIYRMDVLVFKGTLIVWRNGQTGTLRISAKGNGKSCSKEQYHQASMYTESDRQEAAFEKRSWGSWSIFIFFTVRMDEY